VEGNI